MNYRMIFYLVGWVLNFQGVLTVLPSLVSIIYRENTVWDFLLVMAICFAIGIPLTRKRPQNDVLYARDGFFAVALIWIMLSVFGSLPFVISGEIPNFVDALFETASGYTTTGASVVPAVEELSNGILFWRSFTHWVGGMGVLVLLLAILPLGGGHNFHLMRAESPGPSVAKLVPKLRTTAFILYAIYLGMTVLQVLLLLIFTEMTLFESLLTTFASAGTGGFGFRNDSMGSFSVVAKMITAVFMVLFGVNFTVYYLVLTKRPKQALKSEEFCGYIGIVLLSTLLIAVNVRDYFSSFGESLHQAFFQVSSIITTTGFSSTDFNLWPTMSKSILLGLMFIGASAGSTGGGLKVSRVVIYTKIMFRELFRITHPRGMRKITFEGRALPAETVRDVSTYLVAYVVVYALSVFLISFDGFDLTTNISAIAATLNNVGPGFEVVGPMGNFGGFSAFSKLVMTFDMLAGRLELLPMLILFAPGTWRR